MQRVDLGLLTPPRPIIARFRAIVVSRSHGSERNGGAFLAMRLELRQLMSVHFCLQHPCPLCFPHCRICGQKICNCPKDWVVPQWAMPEDGLVQALRAELAKAIAERDAANERVKEAEAEKQEFVEDCKYIQNRKKTAETIVALVREFRMTAYQSAVIEERLSALLDSRDPGVDPANEQMKVLWNMREKAEADNAALKERVKELEGKLDEIMRGLSQ